MIIFWTLIFLAVTGIALAVVASMRSSSRNAIPAVVSPEAARRHRAVIYLIRGTEIAVAAPILALIALIGLGFFLSINPFRNQTAGSEAYSVIMLIAFLVVVAGIVAKSIVRYRNFGWSAVFRNVNFLKVDTNSVSNFAFFFAAFAAHDLYHYLPPTNHTAGHQAPGRLGFFSIAIFCGSSPSGGFGV
jgi:hypothetical protein